MVGMGTIRTKECETAIGAVGCLHKCDRDLPSDKRVKWQDMSAILSERQAWQREQQREAKEKTISRKTSMLQKGTDGQLASRDTSTDLNIHRGEQPNDCI
tara:strand:- start:644 stop:943 length:300 start_codon:yes stop_codon:yes gene_type:complete